MDLVNKLSNKLNFFYHNPVCWGCGTAHQGKKLTCSTCDDQIKRVFQACKLCGLSHQGKESVCVKCVRKSPKWAAMYAPLSYAQPVSHLIQQLKYNQKLDLLSVLIELVLPSFESIKEKPEILIPVPLHKNRYINRGFNQSFEITVMLSKALNIPFAEHLTQRVIDTKRQSELSLKLRQKNIKNAFVVSPKIKQYQHIALVDDVITTGSTIKELTQQCLKAGVNSVDVWALARAEVKSK